MKSDQRRPPLGSASRVASMYLIVLMTSLSVRPTPSAAAGRKPNIVIFVADDLGIGDIGCFGNDTIRTPNIDRIGREGAILTHHLSASSLCTPSRAALLTGRLPIRTGMIPENDHRFRILLFATGAAGLPPNETTFATVAKQHGYRTALIGKWHLGIYCPNNATNKFCHHPHSHGFDYFYGVPVSNSRSVHPGGRTWAFRLVYWYKTVMITNTVGSILFGLALFKFRFISSKPKALVLLTILCSPTLFIYFFLSTPLVNSMLMRDKEIVEQPIHFQNMTQRLVREGVGFIERARKTQQESDEPFLLVMPWLQVHTKLHASHLFRGLSKHGPYGDEVEEMDWGVGQIVNCLERLDLLDNTLIFFTSDNGGHVEEIDHETGRREGGWNGIYRGGKAQDVMDGGIRMPTVAMWRGHIPPGTVVNVPTSHMDLLPTLSAVWSEPLPEDRVIDGRNIYPLLTGASREPPHRLLVHYCGNDLQAVRYVPGNGDDVYKLYYATPNWIPGTQGCGFACHCDSPAFVTRHDPPLLYNIGRDPSETRMLSIAEHRDVVQKINDEVELHRKSLSRSSSPCEMTVWKMLPRLWYQPCCNFPYCDCVDSQHADLVA